MRPDERDAEDDARRALEDRRRQAHDRVCAIFDLCREAGTARGDRDAALISLLFGARLAPSEAVRLPTEAYDPESGRLGAPIRPVRIAREGAREALADWLRRRGRARGPLICPLADDGEPRRAGAGADGAPLPLSLEEVDRVLRRRARSAGVDPERLPELKELYRSPWWEGVPHP